MAIYTNNPLLPSGLIMPNTPVEGIPSGFSFVRIESHKNEFALIWLKCDCDGIEYPFQCDWKSEKQESLVVGIIDNMDDIRSQRERAKEKRISKENERLILLQSKINEKIANKIIRAMLRDTRGAMLRDKDEAILFVSVIATATFLILLFSK